VLRVTGGGAGKVLQGDAAKAYVTEKLQPTLVKALTALAKAKPSSGKAEALTFVAYWLLENNPNKPRLVVPEAAKSEARAAVARKQQEHEELQLKALL